MTDNRTTELREMLTERGVEWTPRDSAFRKVTYWKRDDGKPVYYADATLGILCMTCTPEQAIAATLGAGECELEPLLALDVTLNMLNETSWGVCSECGTASPIDATFCCECGKAVKR